MVSVSVACQIGPGLALRALNDHRVETVVVLRQCPDISDRVARAPLRPALCLRTRDQCRVPGSPSRQARAISGQSHTRRRGRRRTVEISHNGPAARSRLAAVFVAHHGWRHSGRRRPRNQKWDQGRCWSCCGAHGSYPWRDAAVSQSVRQDVSSIRLCPLMALIVRSLLRGHGSVLRGAAVPKCSP
jgi:hypothetical protein